MKFNHDRKNAILGEWREAQGERDAGGIPEVMQALEFIANPIAAMLADRDDPHPLRLGSKQIRIAQQRAISLQRLNEFGILPNDLDVWWGQIAGIAQRWGIATTLEDWELKTRQAAA